MHVQVNGVHLYFDVEGAGLVPDGPRMRKKPTLLLLHGGPGAFDHSHYKPAFSTLSDIAQIVYYDHRGNGRSDAGDPATWTLAQWGDDVRGLCDALGIERPIVFGQSFGGFVAQAYATRHPDHPAKLILWSTAAQMDLPAVFDAFERLGGMTAREIAEGRWLRPSPETVAAYREQCFPLYNTRGHIDAEVKARAIIREAVALHFSTPGHELSRMDFRAALAQVQCPTLVVAGEEDPITPPAFSEVIARCLPPHLVRFERFSDCGHGVHSDDPERAFSLLRDFIQS
jgi:pimeloyl-ACP methyl ester carboxylesterase